jgi:hypothetical protein
MLVSRGSVTTDDAKKTSVNELLRRLSASEKGLSSSEVIRRLQQYGPNEIPEKKASPVTEFLGLLGNTSLQQHSRPMEGRKIHLRKVIPKHEQKGIVFMARVFYRVISNEQNFLSGIHP